MATDEEIYRIIVQTEGQADVERLTAEVKKEEADLRKLIGTLGVHAAATRASAASLAQLRAELQKAQGAAGVGGLQQAISQAGYAVDDLQYGFRGIANNIQPILTSIPALSSMAGPISIAAIAAFQFYEHWDQISKLLGRGVPPPALTGLELLSENLKKAQVEMDELKKRTNLEWYELKKLRDLQASVARMTREEETQKAVNEAGKSTSESEKEAGAGFARAIAETGGTRSIAEIQGALADQKDARGLVYNTVSGNMTTAEAAARDMTAAALKGDKIARDAIRAALAKNSALGQKITELSPEQKAADEKSMEGLAAEESGEDTDKFIRDLRKARKKKAADDLKTDAGKALPGFGKQFGPEILANVARGQANDPAALTAGVAGIMKGQGRTQEEIARLSPEVARMLLEQIEGRIQERAAEGGLNRVDAAEAELTDEAAAARRHARKATGGTSDLAGFAANLQASLFQDVDPTQSAIKVAAEKTAKKLEELLAETKARKVKPAPVAMAAGPA